ADIYTSTVRDGAFSLADYDFKDYTNEAVITVEITAYPSTHKDPDDYYYELSNWDIEGLKTNNLISVDSVTNGEDVDEYGNPTLTFTIKPQLFENDDFDTISASFVEQAIPVEPAVPQSVSYNMPQVASVSYAMPIDDEDENTTIPDGVPQFIAKVLGYKETTDDLLELEITDTISIYVLANPDTTDDSYDLQEQSKINSDEVVITLDNIQVIEKDITIYEGSKDQVNGVVKPYQNVGTITAPSGTQVSVMYEVSSKSLHASYVNANINVDIDDLIYIKDKETDADSGALGKYFKVPTGANNKVITLYYNPIYDFNGILYETSITPISSGGYVVELEAYGFLKSYMNSVHEAGSLDPDYIYSDEYMYKTYGYLIKAKEYVYLYWDKDGIPSIVDEDDVITGLQTKHPNTGITNSYDLENDPNRLLVGNDSTEGYSRTAANLKNATIQVPDFVEKITAPNATTYQLNHGSDNKVELDGDLSYVETGDGSYTNTGIFNSGTTKYVDEDSKSTIYGTINIKLIPDRDIEQTYIEGNIEYLVTQSGDTITVEIVNFLGGPTFINRRLKIFYDENGNLAEQSATTATFEYEEISNYNNIVVPMGQVEGITTISSSISDGSDPIVITFVHEDYETVTLSTKNGILIPEENTGNTRTSITLTTNTVVYLNLIDTRIFYTSNDINYIIEDRGDGYKAYFYELNNEDLETITIPSTIQVNTYDGEPVRQGETNNGWENIDIETTFTLDISEVPNIKTLTLPAGSVFTLTHPYTTDLSASFVEGGSGSGSIDDTSSYVQTIFKVTESSNATFNVVVSVRDLSGGGSDGNTDGDSDGNTGGDSSGGDSSGGDSSGGDSSGGDSSGGDSSGGDSSGGDSSVTPNPDDDDDDDDDKDEDKDVYYTIRNQSSSRLDLDVSSALEGDKVIIYYDDLDDDEEISVTTASGTTIKTYTEKSGVSVYFTMPAETVYVNIDTIETEVDSYYLTAYLEEDQGYVRINGSYVSTDGKKISIDEGEAVTLRAYTEAGYIFDSWSISGSARADVKAQLQEQEDEYNDALYEDLDDDDDEDDVEELDIYKEKTIDIIMPAGNFSITANFIVDEDYEKDSDDDDEDDTTSTTPTMPVAPSVTVPNLDYSGSYNPNYSTDTSPYAMILGRYIDVQSHWGKDAIGYMLNRGLFNGTATNQFSPNLQMTRSMFVTVLSRIDNVNTSIMPVTPFTDVPSTAWYSGEVSWAINNRIATGKTATTFEPDSSITREDMALFLYNYMIEAGLTLPLTNGAISFIDSGDISAGASTAVKYMQQAGIIEGKGSGVFDPKGYSTRAEVCALLMRFLEATGK
ncbi:MAG: S-layer homology domain-containing protein, partial [bacterium]